MSISLTGSGPSIEMSGSGSSITLTISTGGGSSGGVTDHGALAGLGDDDHSQYHNDARGDARYLRQSNDLSDVDDAATARTNLGAGDASGPASATDSAIALFDGTGGKALKDSAVAISTDDTLASDSDAKVPTEQAVKAYVDANAGGGGGGLWQQHSETTLGSAASSVALSFPATYQSIRIVAQLQSTHSAKINIYGRINGDPGTNYQVCTPPPNSGYEAWAAANTVLLLGEVGATSATEDGELLIEHEVPRSGKYPLFRTKCWLNWVYVDRQDILMAWSRWLNTVDAISTLTVMAQAAQFEAGSYFRVEYIA